MRPHVLRSRWPAAEVVFRQLPFYQRVKPGGLKRKWRTARVAVCRRYVVPVEHGEEAAKRHGEALPCNP